MRGGLKVLSGRQVVDILAEFGFVVIGGTKHLKLRCHESDGDAILIIPNHDEIAKGTLRAIFVQASRYVPQAELHPRFYND